MSTEAISQGKGKRYATVLVALLFLAVLPSSWSAVQRSDLTLLRSSVERIPAQAKTKELFFQLPEHVIVENGTELRLTLQASEVPADLFTLSLSLNGKRLTSRPGAENSAGGSAAERAELTAPVDQLTALHGWNRLEIGFDPSKAVSQEALAKGSWLLHGSDCKVSLAYSRLPVFPELGRFPASFGEEKLLQSSEPGAAPKPLVTLVLPKILRDVHLRALVIIAARLGQLEYFTDHDYALVLTDANSWKGGDSIIIGTWDEIGRASVVTNCANMAKPLQPGHGVVAEAILGATEDQHRFLVVSGSDDVGLEKAALTLGNSRALAVIRPSPAIVSDLPVWPEKPRMPPPKIESLNQAVRMLVPDDGLQLLTFVVPLNSSANELRMLADLALFSGQRLPGSPSLSPQAYGYDEGHPVAAPRLRGKSVLLLGEAKLWRRALSPRASLSVADGLEKRVRIQGRSYPLGQFDPSLTILQLATSRDADQLLVAGGWESFDSPKLKWMLTDPEAPAKVFGTVAAVDSQGRIVCYDIRHAAADSLAERITKYIPPGLSNEETERLVQAYEAQRPRSRQINRIVFYGIGALLAFLVATRLILLWDQARRREKSTHDEKPLRVNP